ncbi:MAG: bacteriohopanetetrol glucosamine biosynthesis glycosyltransferase HpnI [Caulobacteraceae bacterium]
MKPLRGAQPGLFEALESFLRQDYGGPMQLVLGLHDAADPAAAVAERLRREHPQADIEVVIDGRVHGTNGKVSNLINMLEVARHELLIISDADITVAPDYLSRVAAAAGLRDVGAVTCFYRGQGQAGFWSRLAAMGVSYGFLPNVVLGMALGLANPCMGSTIALDRRLLDEIGGLEAFADVLADDYEIGRAVRARGLRVAVPPLAVTHGCAERRFGELVAHELRWAVTIRRMDPLGHAGSVITHPLPLAVLAAACLGFGPLSVIAICVALAARLWLIRCVDGATGVDARDWPLLPLRDFVSFGVFVWSLFARNVSWGGTRFAVSSDGKLTAA